MVDGIDKGDEEVTPRVDDAASGLDEPASPVDEPAPAVDDTIKLDVVIAKGSLSLPSHFGRYQVQHRIGIGGFASVYAALDPELDSNVAIKVLAENHSANTVVRQRFVAEARVARRLGNERLIGVFDLGETDDGRPYVVMELAPRGTLRQRVVKTGRPSPADLIRLISELGACMSAVHAKGIVHRDIKPSNLLFRADSTADDHAGGFEPTRLIEDDERLVLADFGLARDISDGVSAVTIGGGTEGYMAPEQADPRGQADVRADIFAATVVVAEFTTGRHPERLDLTTAEVSTDVLAALTYGMAIDRNQRPSSATEWAEQMVSAYRNAAGRQPGGNIDAGSSLDTAPLDRTRVQAPYPYAATGMQTDIPATGLGEPMSFVARPDPDAKPPPPPGLPLRDSQQPPPPVSEPDTPEPSSTPEPASPPAASTPGAMAPGGVAPAAERPAPPASPPAGDQRPPTATETPAPPASPPGSPGASRPVFAPAQGTERPQPPSPGPNPATPPHGAPTPAQPTARTQPEGPARQPAPPPATPGVGVRPGPGPAPAQQPVAVPPGVGPVQSPPPHSPPPGPGPGPTAGSRPGSALGAGPPPGPGPGPGLSPIAAEATTSADVATARSKEHLRTAKKLARLERKNNRKRARKAARRRRRLLVVNFFLSLIRGALGAILVMIIVSVVASVLIAPVELDQSPPAQGAVGLLTVLGFFWGMAYFPVPRPREI